MFPARCFHEHRSAKLKSIRAKWGVTLDGSVRAKIPMKKFDFNIFKIAAKFGLLMGIAFCGYTVFMWLTGLDTTYLHIGQYLDIAILILPITIIFLAIRSATAVGTVSVVQRVAIAIGIGFISFLVYAPFLFAYHSYINPAWFDSVLTLKESELIAKNVDAVLIAEQLEKMKATNKAQSGIMNGFLPSVIILPVLISLLSLPFIRKRKTTRRENPVRQSQIQS